MVPYLIATAGPNAGSTYILKGRTLVGRCEDCDIQLLEVDVSRRHALILKAPNGSFRIGDLTSTNGTFVSGDRITGQALAVGDTVELGTTTLLFLQAETYADLLNSSNVDELKLVSGPAVSSTQEIPLSLSAQLRIQPARCSLKAAEGAQVDIATQPIVADRAWSREQERAAMSSDRRFETGPIPGLLRVNLNDREQQV